MMHKELPFLGNVWKGKKLIYKNVEIHDLVRQSTFDDDGNILIEAGFTIEGEGTSLFFSLNGYYVEKI